MEFLLLLPLLIFSVILHEVSHGLVALGQGDDTALMTGRLTLNPLPHLDPIGSVLFPLVCIFAHLPVFGWAKPVPINPSRFTNYRSGMVLVSMAGPVSNLLIAGGFATALYLSSHVVILREFAFLPSILSQAILLNLVLAVFNLVPVPPLDGSRVMSVVLPQPWAGRYDALEPYGFFIVMGLIATGLLGKFMTPVVYALYRFLLTSFGLY